MTSHVQIPVPHGKCSDIKNVYLSTYLTESRLLYHDRCYLFIEQCFGRNLWHDIICIFCDIVWTKRKRISLVVSMFMILLIQAIIYQQTSSDMVRYLYPLVTHAPLAVVLLYYES